MLHSWVQCDSWAVRSTPARCGGQHLEAVRMPKSTSFYKVMMVEGFVKWWTAALTMLPVPCSEWHCECASSVISLKLCGVCDCQGCGGVVWEQRWITEALSRQDSAVLCIHIPADFSQLSSWMSAHCLSQRLSVTVLQRLCLFLEALCLGLSHKEDIHCSDIPGWPVTIPSDLTTCSTNSWNQWMLRWKSDLLWINKMLEAILERKLQSFAQWGSVHYSCAAFCLVSANFILGFSYWFISQPCVFTQGAWGVLV